MSQALKRRRNKLKLIVDEVNYGLVPYGPGTGTRAIGISFKEVEGDFDYEPELDENGKPKVENEKVVIATGILNDILKVIKDKKYEDAWVSFLLGREYVYFIGEVIAAPEYREIIGIMFKGISETALEIQKKTFSEVPDEERLAAVKNKLRAPMPVFVCKPKYYTGRDMFYENFNLVLLQLPLTEEEKINQMTMVEVSNHAFSTFVMKINKDQFESQKEQLKKKYEDINALSLNPSRIFIIDESGSDDIAEFALQKGYRLNHTMSYSSKYQLPL